MRDTAVEAIRKALMDGRFLPGEALSEATLASEMAISRGPVREALLVLGQQGLVTHSHNYGFSVARFTEQDRLEVLQVRLPLETLALQLARARVTVEDLAILDQFKEKLVCAYVAGVWSESARTDFQFHLRIWERSSNTRLVQNLSSLLTPYYAYGSVFQIGRPDLSRELLERQHASYIDFLSSRSQRSAEDCVKFHLGL